MILDSVDGQRHHFSRDQEPSTLAPFQPNCLLVCATGEVGFHYVLMVFAKYWLHRRPVERIGYGLSMFTVFWHCL